MPPEPCAPPGAVAGHAVPAVRKEGDPVERLDRMQRAAERSVRTRLRAGARFGVRLSPVLAAAAMGLSSAAVVSNALRLRRGPEDRRDNR